MMDNITVTPIYVALTAFIMFVLFQFIAIRRWKTRIGIGFANDEILELRIRRFGNLIEHAPIILVMMFFMELQGVSKASLHFFGSIFIICRILHPIGLFKNVTVPKSQMIARAVGVTGTAILYLVGIGTLLTIAVTDYQLQIALN